MLREQLAIKAIICGKCEKLHMKVSKARLIESIKAFSRDFGPMD